MAVLSLRTYHPHCTLSDYDYVDIDDEDYDSGGYEEEDDDYNDFEDYNEYYSMDSDEYDQGYDYDYDDEGYDSDYDDYDDYYNEYYDENDQEIADFGIDDSELEAFYNEFANAYVADTGQCPQCFQFQTIFFQFETEKKNDIWNWFQTAHFYAGGSDILDEEDISEEEEMQQMLEDYYRILV